MFAWGGSLIVVGIAWSRAADDDSVRAEQFRERVVIIGKTNLQNAVARIISFGRVRQFALLRLWSEALLRRAALVAIKGTG
jgi:hypothetical protein